MPNDCDRCKGTGTVSYIGDGGAVAMRRCGRCLGAGTEPEPCPVCNGAGEDGYQPTWLPRARHDCGRCSGTGYKARALAPMGAGGVDHG